MMCSLPIEKLGRHLLLTAHGSRGLQEADTLTDSRRDGCDRQEPRELLGYRKVTKLSLHPHS